MNAMHYKNYSAQIGFDDEEEVFVGRIAGISDTVTFHAKSETEISVEHTVFIFEIDTLCDGDCVVLCFASHSDLRTCDFLHKKCTKLAQKQVNINTKIQ